MNMTRCFELYYDGYLPNDIVRELDLSEVDTRNLAEKINLWLNEILRESQYQDNVKSFE